MILNKLTWSAPNDTNDNNTTTTPWPQRPSAHESRVDPFTSLPLPPNFKPLEFDGFKKQAGLNNFTLTPKQWIEKTGSILVFFPRRVATREPMRTRISPLSLHNGYPLNLSSILSRNSNGSKRMNESSSAGISKGIWPCISSSVT